MIGLLALASFSGCQMKKEQSDKHHPIFKYFPGPPQNLEGTQIYHGNLGFGR